MIAEGAHNKHGLLLLAKTTRRSENHPYACEWIVFCAECLQENIINGCDFHLRKCPTCKGTGRA